VGRIAFEIGLRKLNFEFFVLFCAKSMVYAAGFLGGVYALQRESPGAAFPMLGKRRRGF
jgi:hypothetical protein